MSWMAVRVVVSRRLAQTQRDAVDMTEAAGTVGRTVLEKISRNWRTWWHDGVFEELLL
jgi:hypothetical protein